MTVGCLIQVSTMKNSRIIYAVIQQGNTWTPEYAVIQNGNTLHSEYILYYNSKTWWLIPEKNEKKHVMLW